MFFLLNITKRGQKVSGINQQIQVFLYTYYQSKILLYQINDYGLNLIEVNIKPFYIQLEYEIV